MLLKIWIISSAIIYALSFIILEIKFANLPIKIRMAVTRSFDVGLIVKCFIPGFNLLVLLGAVVWSKADLFK